MSARSDDAGETVALAAAGVVIVAVLGLSFAEAPKTTAPAASSGGRLLHVPHFTDALKLDGELDEASWRASARSGPFVRTDGKEATPYSDARFGWDDSALRIGLYAADQDIVAAQVPADGPVTQADAFHVVIATNGVEHVFDVGPTCVLADGERRDSTAVDYKWQSESKLACDSDGTINVAGDLDEEWVVEMEIPLAKLGLAGHGGEHADITIRRCEVGNGKRATANECGEFRSTTLVFDR